MQSVCGVALVWLFMGQQSVVAARGRHSVDGHKQCRGACDQAATSSLPAVRLCVSAHLTDC